MAARLGLEACRRLGTTWPVSPVSESHASALATGPAASPTLGRPGGPGREDGARCLSGPAPVSFDPEASSPTTTRLPFQFVRPEIDKGRPSKALCPPLATPAHGDQGGSHPQARFITTMRLKGRQRRPFCQACAGPGPYDAASWGVSRAPCWRWFRCGPSPLTLIKTSKVESGRHFQ